MKKGTVYADCNFDHQGFIKAFTKEKCEYEILDDGILIVFEKYYLRNNSTAGASILVKCYGEEYKISIITSSAGVGLMNVSYGAEYKLFNYVYEEALKYGAAMLPGYYF